MKLRATWLELLGVLAPLAVRAVYRDQVDHIDFHHRLVGLPQRESTFFHRPRKADRGSLLYTLSDVGVLGAVNPSNGELVWRHEIAPRAALLESTNRSDSSGITSTTTQRHRLHLKAAHGEAWICSAYGGAVQAWDAAGGRAVWTTEFAGTVRDLEVAELPLVQADDNNGGKDVLVLSEERDARAHKLAMVVRWLSGDDGSVVWEFRDNEDANNTPLQVSTSLGKVFVVSLHGSGTAYSLQVTVLDARSGRKLEDVKIGNHGIHHKDIAGEDQVLFVGANSAAPVVAWKPNKGNQLAVNVLGTPERHDIELPADTESVEVHAPHLAESQPHFLIHVKTKTSHQAHVYHVDVKTKKINRAYSLPDLAGDGAFSTSSIGADVFFTRITNEKVIVTSSQSSDVLGQWKITNTTTTGHAIHAVSEVVRRSDGTHAVRVAAVTADDNWCLARNGEEQWNRPEGMSGAVAATFTEIPEPAGLAEKLEFEAHSNLVQAYIHRFQRHYEMLQYLPEYLDSIPRRVLSSILGKDLTKDGAVVRDGFGLNKLIVIATKRGRVYCLESGNAGRILWSLRAYQIPATKSWNVKGMFAEEHKDQITIAGAEGERIVLRLTDGHVIDVTQPGARAPVQSTVVVDSNKGRWLLPIGEGGKVDRLAQDLQPKQYLVVRGSQGELKGVTFLRKSEESVDTWQFIPPAGEKIITVAARDVDESVSSIGRVLGDRSVLYKYLNPNAILVATGHQSKSWLILYVIDSMSGQILASSIYTGVDLGKSVDCVVSENWYACTFYGQYKLRDAPDQSVRGWHLTVADLYESELPNYRGPLGDAKNYSSLYPLDSATGMMPFPHIVSQSYIIGARMVALSASQTKQGISTKQLLGYLPETHTIMGLPRMLTDPRRIVGREPNNEEREEGLTRYNPVIEMDPRMSLSHEREVFGVRAILAVPALIESTSLICAYGIDVWATETTPSGGFDVLGKGFNKLALLGTLLALLAGVMLLDPMVRRKGINLQWGNS